MTAGLRPAAQAGPIDSDRAPAAAHADPARDS